MFFCYFQAKEIASLKYDIEQHKDAMSSQEMKSKWHQNKLKIEQESHKVTFTCLNQMLDHSELDVLRKYWNCEQW